MDRSLTESAHRVDGVRIGRTDHHGGSTMSTTKMTTRTLAVAAVLGLASACATPTDSDVTVPAAEPSGSATEEEAPEETEGEDPIVLPEDSYRLELECARPGQLLPC
jgi:hypothetical protein